jgi:hypothetical protein
MIVVPPVITVNGFYTKDIRLKATSRNKKS